MTLWSETTLKRTAASFIDATIEVTGGMLGSYFGMLVAALLETVNDNPAEQIQSSMWSGFGFGFVFWTLSISFLNRVLVQGISRASIGKKILNLELISTRESLTWNTILGRWVMGFGSFALFGAGYVYAFFNKEGRTFHDFAAHTDVVPAYVGSSMSVEYREEAPLPMPKYQASVQNLIVLPQTFSERPMATVIQLSTYQAKQVRKTGTDDEGSGSQAA